MSKIYEAVLGGMLCLISSVLLAVYAGLFYMLNYRVKRIYEKMFPEEEKAPPKD